jgi:predicted O-methyltransferase YrrM
MINLLNPNPNELFEKWRHITEVLTRRVFTFTTGTELSYLCEYATRCTSIIEIGGYVGRSAKCMLLANPDLHLITIDTWDDEGTKEEYQFNLRHEIMEGRVEMFHGDSKDVLRSLFEPGIWSEGFDGAWIDGGHNIHHLEADTAGVMKLLPKGTLICGHDWYDNPTDEVKIGVQKNLPHAKRVCESIWAAVI